MKYVKFRLQPGQQSPDGSTSRLIPGTDWIVWAGPDGSVFPAPAIENIDMTAEEIAAIQPDAVLAYEATSLLDLIDAERALVRSVALAALDELNAIRSWLVSFKAAVATAASLSQLKESVALLPDTPDRTRLQLRNVIRGHFINSDLS